MSLLSALYTGVSGLQTFGESIQVIGDNISNVNTVGFKSSRAEFSDLLSQSLGGGSGRGQIGRGVQLDRVTRSFSQGSFSNTDRLTDMAVNGNGFFIVNSGERTFFTRNGQVSLNNNGEIVTSDGHTLMGYKFAPNGDRGNALEPLNVTTGSIRPNPTGDGTNGDGIHMTLNLNSATVADATAFDKDDASGTSDFSTSITIYDDNGQSHSLEVYFKKTADNVWSWHGLIDGGDVAGGAEGVPEQVGTGTLNFTSNGAFSSVAGNSVSITWPSSSQTIGLDFGETIADGGDGLGGTTQFANPNVIHTQSQDGYAAGSLASLSVASDGVISGIFTNGRTLPIGQVALANFANVQGLISAGSGLYNETGDSGAPNVGDPASGSLGTISAFSLELSNVDLATEFVNLISLQRAYQANTKIITTGDQLLNEVVNIVR
jgi:flagellar hook protein FlgE